MSEPKLNENQLTQNIQSGRDANVAGRDMTMTTHKTLNLLMPIFLIGTLAVLGGLAFSLINPGAINQQLQEQSQPENEE